MYAFGRARTQRMMSRNEEGGRANNNPYAQAIYRRFVLPLAAIIKEDTDTKKPGRRKAHTALLLPMDPEAVAYLAVRNVLNTLMNGTDTASGGASTGQHPSDHGSAVGASARGVVNAVGKAVYHELLLGLFETAAPDLFFTLVNDLGRRMSKSERHRMTVFKLQAKDNGIPFPEWGTAGVQQVGAYLVDQLEQLGLVETSTLTIGASRASALRTRIDVRLTGDVLELIGQIKGHIVETTPYYLPCIEPPCDWTSIRDGGFHTNAMRRMQPFAVRSHGGWSEFDDYDIGTILAAINSLQRVSWRINGAVLDVVRQAARHFDMEEILSQAEFPAPPRPVFLTDRPDLKQEQMTPDELAAFIDWKRAKSQWFTEMKLRGTKYGRFYTATTVADKFRGFSAIHFVYFADFRGRLYAQTTGVSPQGSDMQKALLHFADGKPLDTVEAEHWFMIHGANKWGQDKLPLQDRIAYIRKYDRQILEFAADPIGCNDWRGADKPLQFLAWCLEYAEWRRSPHTFVSRLPIGMDGSCNGLQNFSAMLRDEVGGKATNLVPAAIPHDIYQMVADVTALGLRRAEPDEHGYRDRWLAHGIGRSLVKRSVMTLPYGSTRFSCADFIVDDYLKQGKATQFAREEYRPAAQYLSHFVWDAIAEVVVKAREAMTWLQAGARQIIRAGQGSVRWVTPAGFPVTQYYQEQDNHRIRTSLCGNAFLRLSVDNDTPDGHRHRNGIAPNFVHSYDAAHLHLVTVVATAEGLNLAMIHDDYGTHAADAARLYRIIREVFVAMYESCDPLAQFAETYDLPAPPARGALDLRQVLDSPYFFS